eukprot:NODE_2349_length_1223_cov_40.385009_g2143_i0.p1 GENE.NODE_2349_length_1223_cov_40.385009_g2143_i0~~NODE_2349_length_1223_cov_40.385009_g2143_i0.p1  ORF type:complete len:307 (-),score=67.80 NODE_2349_length_1223_cov_40.385009_g2143_i0:131-1051(-)
MSIAARLAAKEPKEITVSFEYFPPKTEKGVASLHSTISEMAKAKPLFMDVTWGAGGGTSELTLDLCTHIQTKVRQEANMHLTCTNMPREKIDVALEGCKKAGIRNIVALRGDAPQGQTEWKALDTGFTCALDLVKHIREAYGDYFNLTVAGYPEGHPTVIAEDGLCPPEAYAGEMAYLKSKMDAGGSLIITQLFFDNAHFFKFVKACQETGITIPILPGIMIIGSYPGFKRMTELCKTAVPQAVKDKLESIKDDPAAVKEYGIELATAQCKEIIESGLTHLHFYTLNSEQATFEVMKRLGIPTVRE